MFFKIGVIKISQTSQENTCVGIFFKKGRRIEALQHYQKETPTQVFSCEIFEIFKDTFFYRTPPMTASGSLKLDPLPWVNRRFRLNASLF